MLNILNVAQTGLQTSKVQVENVMNNLANQNTEGYTKRVVDTSELEQIDSRLTGRGVSVDSVTRITDTYMYDNLVTEEAKLSNITSLNSMLNSIESIFYETEDTGLSADLNRYFESIENLKTSPDSIIYKTDLASNGTILVNNLQGLYQDVEDLEKSTIDETHVLLGEVNAILKSIGEVSENILEATGSKNDLYDKRDLLEKELAQYVDVEIVRNPSYELKIGGETAVRFDSNIRDIKLVENYIPQADAFVQVDANGNMKLDTDGNPISNIIDTTTWGAAKPEVQTLQLSGTTTTGPAYFLGTAISGSLAAGGDNEIATANKIAADATIITNWNTDNPDKQIDTITANTTGELTITYKSDMGNVSIMEETSSRGITYNRSEETVQGTKEDSITYTLNNEYSLTVTHGEDILDSDGLNADINGDGNTTNDTVTKDNVVQALVYKINQDYEMSQTIQAYNGKYELDEEGKKILTNNPLHSEYDPINPNKERYLFVESTTDGEAGSFIGELVVNDNANVDVDTGNYVGVNIAHENRLSVDGIDDIHLEIFDEEITLLGGGLKAMIDNIKTDSGNNSFGEYKQMLDNFAQKLSDYSSDYIEKSDGNYVYGLDAIQTDGSGIEATHLGLFTGADVKTLQFDTNSVNNLTQNQLDYLETIQWKDDIDFDGDGLDTGSFSEYYQSLRFNIANAREDVIFNQESQEAIRESLQNTYDQLTKVDSDEEMIALIKFQSAYEANAKMITAADEMLQTLLNM